MMQWLHLSVLYLQVSQPLLQPLRPPPTLPLRRPWRWRRSNWRWWAATMVATPSTGPTQKTETSALVWVSHHPPFPIHHSLTLNAGPVNSRLATRHKWSGKTHGCLHLGVTCFSNVSSATACDQILRGGYLILNINKVGKKEEICLI